MPAGCASVTRTIPVAGSPSSLPLKSVEVETLMLVVFVGTASGVTVVSVLSGIDVFGYVPSVGGLIDPGSASVQSLNEDTPFLVAKWLDVFSTSGFICVKTALYLNILYSDSVPTTLP